MKTPTMDGNFKANPEVQIPVVRKAPVQTGPKHKLITEADVQVCRLNHTRTIVSKIMNSRYLRRWESHKIVLDPNEIRSSTVSICINSICFVTNILNKLLLLV